MVTIGQLGSMDPSKTPNIIMSVRSLRLPMNFMITNVSG